MSTAHWHSRIPQAIQAAQTGLAEGMRDVVDHLGAASQARVPYDMGDLSRSMRKGVEADGDQVVGVVSYDQPPYDVIQHEDPDLRHDPGRTYNYLGGPLMENAPRYREFLAARQRDALGR